MIYNVDCVVLHFLCYQQTSALGTIVVLSTKRVTVYRWYFRGWNVRSSYKQVSRHPLGAVHIVFFSVF